MIARPWRVHPATDFAVNSATREVYVLEGQGGADFGVCWDREVAERIVALVNALCGRVGAEFCILSPGHEGDHAWE